MTMTGSSRLQTKKIPAYQLHKATGQAKIRFDGRDIYLGSYGSAESRIRYGEVIAKISGGSLPFDPICRKSPERPETGPTVAEIVLVYLRHAEGYYVKNGKPTDEFDCIKSAVGPLVTLYGDTPAAQFGPLALSAVRQKMVDGKTWSRKYVNKSIGRIRRCFKHAVATELIGPDIWHKLQSLPPLMEGRTTAVDHAPRHAVPQSQIDAVKGILSQRYRDMIDLQLFTGMRPGEVVALTTSMLDRSGPVWIAKLANHKSAHIGKARTIFFGPKSQAILTRYLSADGDRRLFAVRRDSYSTAVKCACVKLGIPRFSAHWFRHNAATNLREQFGLDGAQLMLGHAHADVTQVYAHLDHAKASAIAAKIG